MWSDFFNILGNFIILIGCVFIFTTIAGFIKFKDPFKMMHVGGVCDLTGIPIIILGCGIIFASRGNFDALFKSLFIVVTLYITSPISTNAISEAACRIYNYFFLDDKGKKEL